MIHVPETQNAVSCTRTNVNYMCYEYDLALTYAGAEETFLHIEYEGAIAELFIDGAKVADDNYDGRAWEIGMRRFGNPERATLRIYALFEGMPVWLQNPPAYVDGRALKLHHISIENEYHLPLE